jgi:ElaB/YqjD/DUF883 family membrane-anchored ribosome-binding protein
MPKAEKRAMSSEDTSKISEEVSGLKAEISRIAETVADFVRTRGADAASHFSDTAQEGWTEAKKKIDCVNKKIHEEPVTACAVAFGIGLVLGLIFSGRRR